MTTLNVPYVHQEHGTPPDFNGKSACGPTSAVMVLAGYGLLDARSDSYSQYGWYVSSQYTNHKNVTFSTTQPDGNGKPVAGAFGSCIREDMTYSDKLINFVNAHDPDLKASYTAPSQSVAIAQLQAGKPVIIGGTVQGWGHVIVLKGLTADNHFVVNDPFWGSDKIYSWNDFSPVVWMGIFGKPLSVATPAPTPTPVQPTNPSNTTDDLSGIDLHSGDFGPGQTQAAGSWVRARPSFQSDHILTIVAKGTLVMFDAYAEDLQGTPYQGKTRWYHIKPGQKDASGQVLHGWIHSQMIDPH